MNESGQNSPRLYVLSEGDLFALVDQVVDKLKLKYGEEDTWIDEETAMKKLTVKAKSTMQELRDNREIRFSQPRKKIILYDRHSIEEYLERHAKQPRRH